MKKKIGLVLGGGGAKGAYQVGVLKALKEYKLLKQVDMISATSIGALNSMKVLENDIDGAIEIWSNISKDVALSKTTLKEKLRSKSIFSREGFISLAKEKIDFKKVSKSKIDCYVIATPISKVENAPCEFKVNGKDQDTIIKYLLASSAIPLVFEPVVINGIKYMDGFGVSNNPIETLKNKGCNLIMVIPLKETSDAYKYSDNNTMIIDFVSSNNNQGFKDGTLDFDASHSIERMNDGYLVAKTLIDKLIKENIIAIRWYQKIKLFFKNKFNKKKRVNYYRLDKVEIENIKNK